MGDGRIYGGGFFFGNFPLELVALNLNLSLFPVLDAIAAFEFGVSKVKPDGTGEIKVPGAAGTFARRQCKHELVKREGKRLAEGASAGIAILFVKHAGGVAARRGRECVGGGDVVAKFRFSERVIFRQEIFQAGNPSPALEFVPPETKCKDGWPLKAISRAVSVCANPDGFA